MIKKKVVEDFNDWMVNVRQQSGAVGEFAMQQTVALLSQERAMNPLRRTVDGWYVHTNTIHLVPHMCAHIHVRCAASVTHIHLHTHAHCTGQ